MYKKTGVVLIVFILMLSLVGSVYAGLFDGFALFDFVKKPEFKGLSVTQVTFTNDKTTTDSLLAGSMLTKIDLDLNCPFANAEALCKVNIRPDVDANGLSAAVSVSPNPITGPIKYVRLKLRVTLGNGNVVTKLLDFSNIGSPTHYPLGAVHSKVYQDKYSYVEVRIPWVQYAGPDVVNHYSFPVEVNIKPKK